MTFVHPLPKKPHHKQGLKASGRQHLMNSSSIPSRFLNSSTLSRLSTATSSTTYPRPLWPLKSEVMDTSVEETAPSHASVCRLFLIFSLIQLSVSLSLSLFQSLGPDHIMTDLLYMKGPCPCVLSLSPPSSLVFISLLHRGGTTFQRRILHGHLES